MAAVTAAAAVPEAALAVMRVLGVVVVAFFVGLLEPVAGEVVAHGVAAPTPGMALVEAFNVVALRLVGAVREFLVKELTARLVGRAVQPTMRLQPLEEAGEVPERLVRQLLVLGPPQVLVELTAVAAVRVECIDMLTIALLTQLAEQMAPLAPLARSVLFGPVALAHSHLLALAIFDLKKS